MCTSYTVSENRIELKLTDDEFPRTLGANRIGPHIQWGIFEKLTPEPRCGRSAWTPRRIENFTRLHRQREEIYKEERMILFALSLVC